LNIPFLGEYERDGETGLDFVQFRYYSSLQGRFLKPDSFGGRLTNPQTLNLYAYVVNNPLKWIDPTGHSPQDPKKDPEPIGQDDKGNPVYDCDCTEQIETEPAYTPPSTIVSITPFYGSYRESKFYFQTGRPVRGVIYAGLAASDVFLLKSAVVGVGKLGLKLFAKDAAEETVEIIVKEALAETSVKTVSREVTEEVAEKRVFHVTPDGVVLPPDPKYKIPSSYVENPYRSGSYGETANGKFSEKLRIDPPTPPGQKGPNYSHYHLDGKKHEFSQKKGRMALPRGACLAAC
jgi:RHS repeat-associated protein